MSECAFCGHPDARHRTIDAIEERIASGERALDVFNDYGWAPSKFLRVAEEVDQADAVKLDEYDRQAPA